MMEFIAVFFGISAFVFSIVNFVLIAGIAQQLTKLRKESERQEKTTTDLVTLYGRLYRNSALARLVTKAASAEIIQ
jgi:hypothetical protein